MVNYYRPAGIAEALSLMASHGGNYVLMYQPPRAKHVKEWLSGDIIDLSEAGLDQVSVKNNELVIGSMVSIETLYRADAIHGLADGLLSQAAKVSATQAMRNLATLGGVLMNPVFPAEIILALLVLDAQVLVTDSGTPEIRIPIEKFVAEANPKLPRGSLLAGVAIPLNEKLKGVLERVARTRSDTSIVSVAVTADGTLNNPKIAIFGASPLPKRYHAAESLLASNPLTEASIEQCLERIPEDTQAVSNYRGSAEYRQAMAVVLTRRALLSLKKS